MYDTINFKITQQDVGEVDFLAEIPCYLDDVGEHYYNDELFISGSLNGLKVTVSSRQVKVKDGSLCKFALGSNLHTMGRQDTQRAVERLSDTLHIQMSKATITRLDLAQNIILKHPPEVYLNHLGALRSATRLQEPNGLYYNFNGGRLCFYDKTREQKTHREQISNLYEGRNVLRYEKRYTKRLAAQLKVCEVRAAMLYDEAFYIERAKDWYESYKRIQKINDITLNFEAMKTKQQLYKMAILSLVERTGGQLEMIAQIKEAQKRGDLSKKQAYDLKLVINEACKIKEGFTANNEAIAELDKKMLEAVRYYR